jgi:hypothetical protein
MTLQSPLATTAIGIFVVAAVATAGDYVWYTYGVEHRMSAGIVHGIVLLTSVGLVLGAARGRVLRGLPLGALSGLGGALIYYLLVAIMDRRTYGAAIPAAWVAMWLLLAALDGRWLRVPQRTWKSIAARGLAAAVFGGLAFYLVLNTLWGRPPATGRNYLVQFFAWAFAWAPGLFALTLGGEPSAASPSFQPMSATTPRTSTSVVDPERLPLER